MSTNEKIALGAPAKDKPVPQKTHWKIVGRRPKSASMTVELRVGSSAQTVELKGVPASSAYFAVK